MNKPITFELAKLLKEKDFNLKVVNYYNYEKLSLISDKDRRIGGLVNYNPINWNAVKEHYTSAPTIAEVVMWCFKKHEIWIHAMMTFKKFTPYIQCDWNYRQEAITDVLVFMQKRFNSPTEAYLAAIEYTLKNIIK